MANYIITKTPEFFKKIGEYNYCSLEDMVLPNKLAIDTETTGLLARINKLFCIQIGTSKNNYIIDLQLYSVGETGSYIPQDVFPYLEQKTLIFHNAKFDLGFFFREGFFPEDVRDTFMASKIIYNGIKKEYVVTEEHSTYGPIFHDFGSCMLRELDIEYNKDAQRSIHLLKLGFSETIQYSFNDVDKLIELHDVLETQLEEGGFMPTYMLHCRYVRALAYMEQCGLPISADLWQEKMTDDARKQVEWKDKIENYIFDELPKYQHIQLDFFKDYEKQIRVSINSPSQMLKVFKDFGIPTKDKHGKNSINKKIISKSRHPFVKQWLDYQDFNHDVTTFGDSVYRRIDNQRIYTSFNPMVDTARLSTSQGEINFLNFPKGEITRRCFVANPGNKMIVCDWAGQETVIAADLSGDEAMTKSVVEGACLHCLLARVLYPEIQDLSDAEIKEKHDEKREASKAPRFAMSYGGNGFTIHQSEGIPLERATQIEKGFKELHKGLYVWGDKEYEKALPKGYITSVDGWRLGLPEYTRFLKKRTIVNSMTDGDWLRYRAGKAEAKLKQENSKYQIKDETSYKFYEKKRIAVSAYFSLRSTYQRLCLNNPVQTRGSHMMKLAGCLIFEWILKSGYVWQVLMCNSVHDEFVLEAPEHLAEVTREKVQQAMIDGGNHYLSNLQIKAEAYIGDSWYSAKKPKKVEEEA